MKISVCDICFYSREGMVEATGRMGFKGGEKIDTCKKHRDWGKQFNHDRSAYYAAYSKLQSKYYDVELKDVHPVVVEVA